MAKKKLAQLTQYPSNKSHTKNGNVNLLLMNDEHCTLVQQQIMRFEANVHSRCVIRKDETSKIVLCKIITTAITPVI